jgi:hypothetical protein
MARATACQHCDARLIFPRTADGGRLPAVELPPGLAADPLGTMAVAQLAGEWVGRFLAAGEEPQPPYVRRAVHHCEGMERQRRRGKWTSAVNARSADQRRRRGARAPASSMLPGMGRIYPGR